MQSFLCAACGTQFSPTPTAPTHCPICMDERQFVPQGGQRWVTMQDLRRHCHNEIVRLDDGLHTVSTRPHFAIGQQAHIIQTAEGNVLWDCIAMLDQETVSGVWALGGLAAIAISHPHYYTSMIEWSRAFGGIPIHLHALDREWVQYPDSAIEYWGGESKALPGGLTLVHCGGHFAGGTVLHWPNGASRRGALLTGDVLQVCPDRNSFGFMYSYPNYIPLTPQTVIDIATAVHGYEFDAAYGALGNSIVSGAKQAVTRSAERYLRAIGYIP